MRIAFLLLGWLFAILFGLLALSMALTRNYFQLIPLLLLVLVVLPPASRLAQDLAGISLPWWGRGMAIAALLGAFMGLSAANTPDSVYTRPEVQAAHMEIYDAKLAEWPTPYEELYLETTYGTVHVIASGPESAPPALLLNASAMSGWSWLYNVGALNKHYRTYAIDTIGEAGKSVLYDVNTYPADGEAWGDTIAEIADALGVEQAHVIGASYGGYIATNYALHHPERVKKLALLGPMGLTPATGKTAARIALVQMFPLKPLQESTVRWALGDDPTVLAETQEWFRLVMTGMFPKEAAPVAFTPEQLQQVDVPTLLILGAKDALTDDPEAVKALAGNVPDIQIEVLDSGHLIGVEQAEQANRLMVEFLAE